MPNAENENGTDPSRSMPSWPSYLIVRSAGVRAGRDDSHREPPGRAKRFRVANRALSSTAQSKFVSTGVVSNSSNDGEAGEVGERHADVGGGGISGRHGDGCTL